MTVYNIEYLNSLIENKVEENLNLDYKAAGALDKQNNKTSEISKDVSALANSDGGILIYGIIEDKVNKHLPEKIDVDTK
ncbi:helix-turn-helix domain-containing protein [Mesoflavibacter zeaxanthinifaciens]|uniref:AlbA family DNA-binding domain-containing protein n=1 Tax=Mesoflavibacter zeaxanthinifaciens TaxID=393060 RepID=UPI003A946ED2